MKYPVQRTSTRRTSILVFNDFSEQRFAKGSKLDAFDLQFSKIPTADKDLVRAFWNSRQGATDTTWSLTINDPDPVTYNHLQFTPGQQFRATMTSTGLWSFTLKVRRIRKD